MDVICQCMEVRSSTEGSEESNLSQLSACSFKKESIRRSSISDVSPATISHVWHTPIYRNVI